MAIKAQGTTVIDDRRRFINISDTIGTYGNLQPGVKGAHKSGSITLDANNPLFILRAEGALTITDMTNKAAGKQSVVLADVSASGYDITFGTPFKFVNDAEPNWVTSRYWLLNFTIWDSSTILVTATSYTGDGASFPAFEGSALGTTSTNGLIVKLDDGVTTTQQTQAQGGSNTGNSYNTEPGRTLLITVFYDPTLGSPCETYISVRAGSGGGNLCEDTEVFKGGATNNLISTYQDQRNTIDGNFAMDTYAFNISNLSNCYFQLGYKIVVPQDLIDGELRVSIIDDEGDDDEGGATIGFDIT